MTENKPENREVLSFESDRGSNRSRWVAGGLALAITAWMGSGYLFPSESAREEVRAPVSPRAVSVAVRRSVAEPVQQVFVAEGQALPDRDTTVRAEVSGQMAQARATLAAAQAGLSEAQEAINDTQIRAPFAGRLEALDINIGEIVTAGADVGRIVDNTPLEISIQIPQQSLRNIKVGQTAEVAFITGETATGEVRFVATSADAETRTFMARIEVANADGAIPAGISARLRIPTGQQSAHFVSPAILSLDTDGTLGIKTVGAENVVEFHRIDIVRAQTDGIWVSGLPDETQIISIGQGFVNDGETVDPQPEDGMAPSTAGDAPGATPELAEEAGTDSRIIKTDAADDAGDAAPEADQ